MWRRLATFLLLGLMTQPMLADERIPTLWIIGDSTVRTGTSGQQGWGDPLKEMFDTDRIRVENHAVGGRSSRTFLTDGRWYEILQQCEPGDFVLMQFGHNDAGNINDDHRARGTIPGLGDETELIDNLITKKRELVHTYGWYLRKYVEDAQAYGLTPIVCSYIPRRPKEPVTLPLGEARSYDLYAEQVAAQTGACFIDLHDRILTKYAALEPAQIKAELFTESDDTHTNPAGAALNAQCVAEGIAALEACELKRYLKR